MQRRGSRQQIFFTRKSQRALSLGPVRLMEDCEWSLRNRPRALRNARQAYRRCCLTLYSALERHYRGRVK